MYSTADARTKTTAAKADYANGEDLRSERRCRIVPDILRLCWWWFGGSIDGGECLVVKDEEGELDWINILPTWWMIGEVSHFTAFGVEKKRAHGLPTSLDFSISLLAYITSLHPAWKIKFRLVCPLINTRNNYLCCWWGVELDGIRTISFWTISLWVEPTIEE